MKFILLLWMFVCFFNFVFSMFPPSDDLAEPVAWWTASVTLALYYSEKYARKD